MLGAVTPVVRLIGVVVLAALLTVDLVVVALLVFVVVRSLAGNAADDPHGHVLFFGVAALLVMVPIGLVVLAMLRRLAGPSRPSRRTRCDDLRDRDGVSTNRTRSVADLRAQEATGCRRTVLALNQTPRPNMIMPAPTDTGVTQGCCGVLSSSNGAAPRSTARRITATVVR